MKIIVIFTALCFAAGVCGAQEKAPDTPQQAAVQSPDTPVAPATRTPDAPPADRPAAVPGQPEVQAPAVEQPVVPARQETAAELKKRQLLAIVELKKSQAEAVRKLKADMKGKSVTDTRQAVADRRIADKAALKALQEEQKKELAEFMKEHPEKKPAPAPAKK